MAEDVYISSSVQLNTVYIHSFILSFLASFFLTTLESFTLATSFLACCHLRHLHNKTNVLHCQVKNKINV